MSSSDDNKPYNPFSHDTLEKMLEKRKAQEHQEALLKEEVEEYKAVVNRLFSSPDGKYFLKKLVRYTGIYMFDKRLDAAKLVEDSGKKKVFLELIRPFLDKTILMELEQ